jgi:hypothetical protein
MIAIIFALFLIGVACFVAYRAHVSFREIEAIAEGKFRRMAADHGATLEAFLSAFKSLSADMQTEHAGALQKISTIAAGHTDVLERINRSHVKAADRLEVTTAALAEAAMDIRAGAQALAKSGPVLASIDEHIGAFRNFQCGPRK